MANRVPFSQKLTGLVRLFRPELPVAAGICVVVGEIIALGGFPLLLNILQGFVCGFLLSAAALILNDYFDLEVDRINAPHRPLPSGLVTPSEVIALFAVVSIIGLAVAFSISLFAFVLSLALWVIGILYNWRFKQAGLPGNLMVSTSVGATFILGGIAVGDPWNKVVWVFSLIAFLIDLAEEIAGDAMDMEGDKKRASQSLALRKGRAFALKISTALFILVVLLSFMPAALGWLGTSYLIMMIIMDAVILLFSYRLLTSQTPAAGRAAMRWIYLGASFGLLAFIFGQLFV